MKRTYRSLIVVVFMVGVIVGSFNFVPYLAGRIAYAVESGKTTAVRDSLAEMSRNDRLSPLFRKVSEAVAPAVVEIRVSKKMTVSPLPPGMEEFYRRFYGENHPSLQGRPPREFYQRGLGSGVIVDAENGYVLTNNHVVGDADEVEVVLGDERKLKAEWVRTDPQSDLAIVKIKSDRLIAAPLGDSEAMGVGDWVLAIGSPEGLPQTVTAGIISAKERQTGRRNAYENFLQTDAAINHGNSGGPLVNMRGEVIGINTAIVSRTGVNEGIGLAIPSNMAKNVMKQLIENGKVTRGYLGVVIQDIDEKLAKGFGLPNVHGALISQVLSGSPADKAGLQEGDVIVAVGDSKVDNVQELRHVVAAIAPGKTVAVNIIRATRPKRINVTFGVQPDATAGASESGTPSEKKVTETFGLDVRTLTERLAEEAGYPKDTRGVIIMHVRPDSDAAEQGLQRGMVIVKVQGKPVPTAEAFEKIMSSKDVADGAKLLVRLPKGQRYFFVTPSKMAK